MWPQFNFDAAPDTYQWTETKTLTGSECLVFFLGGIRGKGGQLRGFSKNPSAPMEVDPITGELRGGSRDGPFFEFDSGRLVDVDRDGMSEYQDIYLGAPYVYVMGDRGYRNEHLVTYGDPGKDLKEPYLLHPRTDVGVEDRQLSNHFSRKRWRVWKGRSLG